MLENSTFNTELNKLQKTFWDNVELKKDNSPAIPLVPLFEQWLIDIDKCWQDHEKVASDDIDSLYKKLSSSSRFLFNSSSFTVADKQVENADALVTSYLEGVSDVSEETTAGLNKNNIKGSNDKKSHAFDINAVLKLPFGSWQQEAAILAIQGTDRISNSVPVQFAKLQESVDVGSKILAEGFKQPDIRNNSDNPDSKDNPDTPNNQDNPDFSAALENYLVALKEYQRLFFNLFTTTAKELLELIRLNKDEQASPTQIMTTWLEVLETNYEELISSSEYSQVYANIINSWMLMLSKSNQSFTEFMQSSSKSSGQY